MIFFINMYCTDCGVPRSYYISAEHSKRQSCRNSISGYHNFDSVGCFAKLYAFIYKRRKTESRFELLKHREERRHTI